MVSKPNKNTQKQRKIKNEKEKSQFARHYRVSFMRIISDILCDFFFCSPPFVCRLVASSLPVVPCHRRHRRHCRHIDTDRQNRMRKAAEGDQIKKRKQKKRNKKEQNDTHTPICI